MTTKSKIRLFKGALLLGVREWWYSVRDEQTEHSL